MKIYTILIPHFVTIICSVGNRRDSVVRKYSCSCRPGCCCRPRRRRRSCRPRLRRCHRCVRRPRYIYLFIYMSGEFTEMHVQGRFQISGQEVNNHRGERDRDGLDFCFSLYLSQTRCAVAEMYMVIKKLELTNIRKFLRDIVSICIYYSLSLSLFQFLYLASRYHKWGSSLVSR